MVEPRNGAGGEVPPDVGPETAAILAGRVEGERSLAPVLYPSSTFEFFTVEEGRRQATSIAPERFYSRYGNPTINAFEATIAELEGAEAARAFASGMGAISAVVLGICSSGDHIVAQRQLYAGTQLFLQTACPRFGIDVTFVDGTQPGAFAEAVVPGKTMLVLAETPANPRLDIIDLDALGSIVNALTVVDSTFATPMGQTPLAHGVDLVLHSATKGIAGHNDATIGVVAGSEDLMAWLWGFAVLHGANASPYDAYNAHRGVRTLGIRLRQQTESARLLADFLEAHDAVSDVRYPGLASHPQHELAVRQMRSMGGLLTFDLAGGLEAGRRFVEATSIARQATSLGGPETLLCHSATTTHVSLTPEELEASGIGEGTVRVSCGLENVDDLVADFGRGLDAAG
ncbi:MAG: PLP-dependent aspartate aminotransferase family protein [Acidimicrobiales bacterium]|jgi:cystathionine beta-lyase/cystathionine gamma-synthase|nr:PLP-dependent aspartate aminotransferase family protein [Acidimicrobiales bacterium]